MHGKKYKTPLEHARTRTLVYRHKGHYSNREYHTWYHICYIEYHIWYHMFYVISYVQLWYHVWYHIWYHGVTRCYCFLGHVISSIFHDIPCDIMPFSLHPMTQETVKSCHTMKSCMKSRKIQWYHHYVISHNCEVTLFCDVTCDITCLAVGWRCAQPPVPQHS